MRAYTELFSERDECTSNRAMKNLSRSALALVLAYTIGGLSNPVVAQATASFEPLEDVGAGRSKIADVDIVTDSPTLQSHTGFQQGQANAYSDFAANAPSMNNATFANPTDSSVLSQPGTQQSAIHLTPAAQTAPAVAPVQIDSQAVGRVVGVAGTALLLGAFLKNGGVGGMMNTLGLDNRFHGRGSSLSGY